MKLSPKATALAQGFEGDFRQQAGTIKASIGKLGTELERRRGEFFDRMELVLSPLGVTRAQIEGGEVEIAEDGSVTVTPKADELAEARAKALEASKDRAELSASGKA